MMPDTNIPGHIICLKVCQHSIILARVPKLLTWTPKYFTVVTALVAYNVATPLVVTLFFI